MSERKSILLRLDPAVHDALARWADDELRSTNAQIEFLLRRALADAGRLPRHAGPMRPRGRPAAGEPAELKRLGLVELTGLGRVAADLDLGAAQLAQAGRTAQDGWNSAPQVVWVSSVAGPSGARNQRSPQSSITMTCGKKARPLSVSRYSTRPEPALVTTVSSTPIWQNVRSRSETMVGGRPSSPACR